MTTHADIVIVGAGMAGASLAAQMAGNAQVLLIEAEEQPGYHATGRSAAFWTESYGGPMVQPLTTASGPFLREGGFLTKRAALTIGRSGQEAQIDAFVERFASLGVNVAKLDRHGIEHWIAGIRPEWSCGALEPDCCDIDVASLHQHYLAKARRGGAQLQLRARLESARCEGGTWRVSLEGGAELRCETLVNAAGAWADPVASACGVAPLGIQPMRRTVAQLRTEPPVSDTLPLCLDISEKFYFKPESGRLWLSPHDESPSQPCDAAPEEIDVATAIDRFESVVDWQVEAVEHRWAGLRSFAPDRLPIFGFDQARPGFFWFAGQGGFGIQTAPAAAALGWALLSGNDNFEVDPAPYSPERFQ